MSGPFSSPSYDILATEHAILVAGGIGVTPFVSILENVIAQLKKYSKLCPCGCGHKVRFDVECRVKRVNHSQMLLKLRTWFVSNSNSSLCLSQLQWVRVEWWYEKENDTNIKLNISICSAWIMGWKPELMGKKISQLNTGWCIWYVRNAFVDWFLLADKKPGLSEVVCWDISRTWRRADCSWPRSTFGQSTSSYDRSDNSYFPSTISYLSKQKVLFIENSAIITTSEHHTNIKVMEI